MGDALAAARTHLPPLRLQPRRRDGLVLRVPRVGLERERLRLRRLAGRDKRHGPGGIDRGRGLRGGHLRPVQWNELFHWSSALARDFSGQRTHAAGAAVQIAGARAGAARQLRKQPLQASLCTGGVELGHGTRLELGAGRLTLGRGLGGRRRAARGTGVAGEVGGPSGLRPGQTASAACRLCGPSGSSSVTGADEWPMLERRRLTQQGPPRHPPRARGAWCAAAATGGWSATAGSGLPTARARRTRGGRGGPAATGTGGTYVTICL
jgi:hypothetical protein